MQDSESLEVIKEFLIESNENFARLEQEMVQLEQRPDDPSLLASVFRTFHTIKGTCGFLHFERLESLSHVVENILNQLRNGERPLTPFLVSLILESVDACKGILTTIESTLEEGTPDLAGLMAKLHRAAEGHEGDSAPPLTATPDAPVDEPAPAAAPTAPAAVVETASAAAVSMPAAPAEPTAPPPADTPVAARPSAAQPQTRPGSSDAGTPVSPHAQAIADSTIRVDVGLLDKLMNLVGELVLARNQILQFSAQRVETGLVATSQRLNLITSQLQEGVMKTRMQPIGMVWQKLPRVVRDLATTFGKEIRVDMDGAETELDKSIIEAIKDPLTHIVRNSCDHGIESPAARVAAGKLPGGVLSLRAFHEGGQVNIEISDDGAGIDAERVKAKAVNSGLVRPEQAARMTEREAVALVFEPGFSTAAEVTNVSGRGVGMDVVKTNIEKIGGAVDLTSRLGEGTTVRIKIPLTLAIIPGLVATSGGERFVIPQVSLQELIRLEGEAGRKQIEWIKGTPVYRRRGALLPIAYLNSVLHLPTPDDGTTDVINIVVLQAEDRQFGLVVDGIQDTQEIVVKPLGKQFKGLSCYSGATIMGDGKVALILDVLGLGLLAGVLSESREQTRSQLDQRGAAAADHQAFLLFKAGAFERLTIPLSQVARLEEFPQARLERAGGQRVVQYRGDILPLLPLDQLLTGTRGDTDAVLADPVQVIVFNDKDRLFGVIVDQVLDILEERITVQKETHKDGLLGSAVIGKRVTDLLDLPAVVARIEEEWYGHGAVEGDGDATNAPAIPMADAPHAAEAGRIA